METRSSTTAETAPFPPQDFLTSPGPEITTTRVNFLQTDLPEYNGDYATILDNVLSLEECNTLLSAAESSTQGIWERAMVNVGNGEQELRTDVRNCGRIIWDSEDIVEKIWGRVKPHVPEILKLENMPQITGSGPVRRGEVWKASRLNERMRFLKYGCDEYFNVHQDGSYITPDGKERTYVTLHLYLNEKNEENDLVGGATTFHGYDMRREYNVYPKIGRVLVFQHRTLLHSGQGVLEGCKYTMRTDLLYRKDE